MEQLREIQRRWLTMTKVRASQVADVFRPPSCLTGEQPSITRSSPSRLVKYYVNMQSPSSI